MRVAATIGALALTFGTVAATTALVPTGSAAAATSECNIASNGSFESPNIQDPANPTPNDDYVNGYNQWRSGQPTISGWSTVAGTVDILRYFNNASDGAQSIDLWGTAPGTMQQTFTGLIPGEQYTFSIDYSGLQAGLSRGSVLLDQGSGFSTLASLSPAVDAVPVNPNAGTPQTPAWSVTWATYSHTFTATGTSATIQLQNQTAPALLNTGLFIDNFSFVGASPCQDFGDAPDSYGTTLANDGARNVVVGYDAATHTAPVMLGSTVDTEADGQPSVNADAGPNEDGVATPIVIAHGQTSSVTVSATNNSDQDVTLAGWVDLNGNGKFDSAERVTTTVPANSGKANYTLTFPAGTTTSNTYARFRIYGSVVADPQPTGNAVGGEVEDYRVSVINPALTTVKHAGTPVDVNGDGITDAGDTIQYTFDVTNSGDVPITNVGVTDAKAGHVTCPDSTLAPGASETCTADKVYTITAADAAAGAVDNTATSTGTDPTGGTVTSPPSTTHTVVIAAAPALTVVKSAEPSGATEFTPGQVITYNFAVTNTGNVPINGIKIVEGTFTGTGTLPDATCPSSTLAPGAQEICTTTYTLTPADVDSGSVSNTATAHGTVPGSDTDVPSDPSTVKIPETPNPGATVVKTASPGTVTAAGQTVTYSFVVTNTGNVTLAVPDGAVQDTNFSGTGTLSPISCPETSLVAGQVETCTATYTVTQADVNTGTLTNTATVTGTTPGGGTYTSPPSPPATVTIDRTPALTVVKTANVQAAEVGQAITYTFTVTNTGNVTIMNPSVADTNFSGTGQLSALNCPANVVLQPGDDTTCTATYTVTQADVDAGQLTNTATATGTPPEGVTPPTADAPPVTVSTSPHPALSLVKTASAQQATTVGQVVTYTFAVTNTGNVDVKDPKVNEGAFTGHGTLSAVTCPGDSVLPPGQSIDCTATYTVVAADLAAGATLSNTATVTGTLPGGGLLTSDPSTAKVAEVAPATPAAALASTGSDTWTAGLVGFGLLVLGLLAAAAAWIQRRHRLN